MNQLRKRMQEEMRRRNYSESTIVCYLRQITEFAEHFGRSPAQLGPEEIKQFQLYLVQEKKVAWATYIQTTAALRFLYVKTLGQTFMADKIPYPKRPKHLPTVLSQEEIERMLKAARSLKHRALMMALYGAGLRVSEACRLTIEDIDSSRMILHVRQSKGNKNRDVMLSTFYPASITKEGATRVEAHSGSDTGGIEIRLARMPIMRVSGTVSGIPQGTQSMSVMLWPRDGSQPHYIPLQAAAGLRGKEFAIWRLPPGHYSLQANATAPDGTELASLPQEIELVSDHVDGIVLDLSPPFTVSGRIEWHGTPPDRSPQEPMTIHLQGGFSGIFRGSGAEKIAADSTFTIPKVFAGPYRVMMTGLPRDAFVRSVQVDSVEFPRENPTLIAAPRQVIVTLSNSGAQISGVVENDKGPVANMGVALVEEGLAPRHVQTDGSGHYIFRGIPPGKYKLAAAYPNIDGSDESRGESIEVNEGDSLTRNLRVPSVP